MRRYPFKPLEAAVHCSTDEQLAEHIGANRRQLYRWRRYGVTLDIAEGLAEAAGLHPFEVWPEMLDDASRPCDACQRLYVPLRSDSRFCSTPCYKRWWGAEMQRRRRERDPSFRERERQRKKRYYAETAEYWRARERRRYHERKETARA